MKLDKFGSYLLRKDDPPGSYCSRGLRYGKTIPDIWPAQRKVPADWYYILRPIQLGDKVLTADAFERIAVAIYGDPTIAGRIRADRIQLFEDLLHTISKDNLEQYLLLASLAREEY